MTNKMLKVESLIRVFGTCPLLVDAQYLELRSSSNFIRTKPTKVVTKSHMLSELC